MDDKTISGTAMGGDDSPSGNRGRVVEIGDGLHGNVFHANLIVRDVIDGNRFGVK
jgi:hypothetical protein